MARYLDVIDVPVTPIEAFEYLADFAHCAQWDPGVVEAERLSKGEARQGSAFRVVTRFFGRRVELRYSILVHEPPHTLVLEACDGSVRSIDEISFTPRAGGTRITYDARLELRGWRRVFDPLLQCAFFDLGRRAARGLRKRLSKQVRGAIRKAG
jgi:hypothetical protein